MFNFESRTDCITGWWFTIESTTTKHLIGQFKSAIRSALASKDDVRALMRVRSGMQRFPVKEWVEDLETLQTRSITAHDKQASSAASIFHFGGLSLPGSRASSRHHSALPSAVNTAPNTAPNTRPSTRPQSRVASPIHSPVQSRAPSPIREDDITDPDAVTPAMVKVPHTARNSFLRKNQSPAVSRNNSVTSFQDMSAIANANWPKDAIQEGEETPTGDITPPPHAHFPDRLHTAFNTPSPSRPGTPPQDESPTDPFSPPFLSTKSKSVLSLQSIVGEQNDFHLQKTDPFFTDAKGVYYRDFEKMLDGVDSKNSADRYCIEKFLVKSEKQWFEQRHSAKLGMSTFSTPRSSFSMPEKRRPRSALNLRQDTLVSDAREVEPSEDLEQFSLGHDFVPVKGLRKFLQRKIGDWQIYSLLLAFVSSTSFGVV